MLLRRKIAGFGVASLASIFAIDNMYYYSTLIRTFRTFWVAGSVALDYKLNFKPSKVNFDELPPANGLNAPNTPPVDDAIERLHTRTAHKIYNLCRKNGGLYIKFGQQIATIPVLPPAYVMLFKKLYDQAPSHDFETVKKILEREYQAPMDEIFSSFDPNAIASASIAQVHKAVLRKNGAEVAVKIQKPEIQTQMPFDLFCYRTISFLAERWFDLPSLSKTSGYISRQMRQEADFINEAQNSEKCQALLNDASSSLRDQVYVPKVDWDLTTKVVMVQEWIHGISLVHPQALIDRQYNVGQIMTTVVEMFADQIFRTGFVHCDPHPGNIIIRDLEPNVPAHSKRLKPQIVLIDHGLYIQSSEEFRRQYCQFWVGMFTFDFEALDEVARAWGIPDIGLFATATLAKPWRRDQKEPPNVRAHSRLTDAFEIQQRSKDRLVEFLRSMDRMPEELAFIGRNMNIVRANNKALGSIVNRINIMAESAAHSIALIRSTDERPTYMTRLESRWNLFKFQAVLFLGALTFYFFRMMTQVKRFMGMKDDGGFEGALDERLKQTLQQEFPGIVIDDSVFDS